MDIKYVAFDVETPNHLNDRISAIGISVIDSEGGVSSKEYFVNPECEFDSFNISLTGITPFAVAHAPTFPGVWAEIEPLFSNHIVVAHNAQFDLAVLRKTLSAYGIQMPRLTYLCTMKLARRFVPDVENYKLSTLSDYFDIPLTHHHAGSDSEACANILCKLVHSGIAVETLACTLSPDGCPREERRTFPFRAHCETTNSLRELTSILNAISSDGILDDAEITFLTFWMKENESLRGNYPYDKIYSTLTSVLADGVITPQERETLLALFQAVSNPVEAYACVREKWEIAGKNICLSGEFDYGSKDQVTEVLQEKGAFIQRSITKQTNILLVGGRGSAAWSSGNYGTKIKKAMEMQTKGADIRIVREADFFNAVEEESMEQIAMTDSMQTDADTIKDALLREIHNPEYAAYLAVNRNKDETISLKAKTILWAKIKCSPKTKYVEVRTKYLGHFRPFIAAHDTQVSYAKGKQEESAGDWSRLSVNSLDEIAAMAEPLSIVYMLVLSDLGGESFGCCGRYLQCSDERKCVNPDFLMSIACSYKRNLESGRIFYGKNKNI